MIKIILLILLLFSDIFGKTYSFKTITVDAGLPQSTISVIVQDYKGFLWVGTHGGIVRYDGVNMKPFTSNEGYPFFLNKGIIEKEPGVLWIADGSEGLWELKNDIATKIIFDKIRPVTKINFIHKGTDGRILVGAEPGGLYIFNKENITRIGVEHGLVSEQVISGAIDKDGHIWVGTFKNGAQHIIDGVPGSVLTVKDGLPGDYVRYILPRSNGEVWFGTKKGLYILSQDSDKTLLNTPGEEKFVFHILEEDERNLWISTANNGGGLIHILDKEITERLDYDSGLRSYKATWSYIDEYGSMFIGTANGLAKITNRQFVNYSRIDGFLEPYITGVCQTDDGTIWVSTQTNGVYQLRAEKFLPLTHPDLEKFQRVKHLSAIGNQVWWATSKGLVITENGIPISNSIVDSLAGKTIRKITPANDGIVYITAFQSLYRITNDTLVDITGNLKKEFYSFWALDEDKTGILWLATNGQGLWQFLNKTWIKFSPPYPSFPENFFGMSKDIDGNLYFSSSRGAYQWDGEKLSVVFSEEHTVWDILPTENNGNWFGTSRGLFQKINKQINHFNMKSGLITSEFNISSFLETQDGALWFGGVGGLVKYRTLGGYPTQTTPNTYILSIENSNKFYSTSDDLTFQPNQNNVTFHWAGIYLGNPESVLYRYKLKGLDDQWSAEVKLDFAAYNHLPDGNYTFLLESKGAKGVWSKIPKSVSFQVLKPWWKTWTAQFIFDGMLVLLVWGIVKWRIQTIQKRNLILEEEVQERTSKLISANLLLENEIQSRKQAKKEVIESRERYRSTIESMKDLIFTIDRDGYFIDYYASEASKLYTPPTVFLKKKFEDVLPLHVTKQLKEAIKKVRSGESHAEFTYSLKIKGKEFWFEATLTAKHDTAGTYTGITAVVRDISIRRRAQEKLVAALEDAKQGEQVKSLFMANMSHEIRTPLNAILGFTDLLETSVGDLVGKEEKEFFDTIRNSGNRLMQTVHEILDISQIDTGTYILNLKTFDLCKLIIRLLNEYRLLIEEKGLKLEYNSALNSAFIKADQNGTSQAISNIIDNAVKYTKQGKITVSLEQKAEQYVLKIQDTGIGITEEYLENLFETFTQESEGYTKKYQGIGLGMAIAQRHLDMNSVGIDVESTKDVGTTFTLTFKPVKKPLPIKRVEKEEAKVKPAAEPAEKPLVLSVEDDPNSQRLIEFFLKEQYDMSFAVSVDEAKQQLKRSQVDLILLDLSLVGDEDGLELVRWMRKTKTWKKTPVIATTAHAFTTDQNNCMAAGCDNYISKPIKRENLLETINEFV